MCEVGFFLRYHGNWVVRRMQEQKKRYPPTHESKGKEEKRDRSRERERERARERANSNEECSVVYMTTSAALKRHFWDPYFRRERNKEWGGGGGFFFFK
jgi:hypothetical protein